MQAYDPAAMDRARALLPGDLACFDDPCAAAAGAEALVLMTEWNEFRNIDWPRIRESLGEPRLLDCRNLYNPREMAELGFDYVSVGRPRGRPGEADPEAGDRMRPARLATVG